MCVFCSILKGEEPAFIVYRDDKFTAFLDKYPVAPGHTLIVTNEHFDDILNVSDDYLRDLGVVLKRLGTAVKEALKADGMRVVSNVGRSAGQVVFHVHIHLIPTWERQLDDFRPRRELQRERGKEITEVIRRTYELLYGKSST
jgi:histidine triad (HIT) family protein